MRYLILFILFRESHGDVVYGLSLPDEPVLGSFDRRLLTQAVTNLVKNAAEAIEEVRRRPIKHGWRASMSNSALAKR